MTEIVVVYELDRPGATGATGGAQRAVRAVHAASTAPGRPADTGPRTLCGKDTFAMERARWKPSEHPQEPWYPTEHASVVCSDCAAVMAI
jgi:hypothetical protein